MNAEKFVRKLQKCFLVIDHVVSVGHMERKLFADNLSVCQLVDIMSTERHMALVPPSVKLIVC